MKKAIRRLRLRRGDAIIVSDTRLIEQLQKIGPSMKLEFDVPIFFVPEGTSFRRVCKEYVLKVAQEIVIDSTVERAAEELGYQAAMELNKQQKENSRIFDSEEAHAKEADTEA